MFVLDCFDVCVMHLLSGSFNAVLEKSEMKKNLSIIFAGFVLASMFIVPVLGEPVEKVDGFVCPVLGGKAGEHGKSQAIFGIYGGDYSVRGGDVSVPAHATNTGFPSIEHGSPGDLGYTAIWNNANEP